LVYWFGHIEAKRNPKLMERLIRTLAKQVNARLENDAAGCARLKWLRKCN
jgi:polyribonucleotide 5'-hydroxyl-kinase